MDGSRIVTLLLWTVAAALLVLFFFYELLPEFIYFLLPVL